MSLVIEFVDWTLHEYIENWYLKKIKPFTVLCRKFILKRNTYYIKSLIVTMLSD